MARVRHTGRVTEPDGFHIEMESHPNDTVTVVLAGELDMADADWVEATLATAAEHHHEMQVDLSQLSFIDSTGMRALVALRQRARIMQMEVVFTKPSPAVGRALEAASVDLTPG